MTAKGRQVAGRSFFGPDSNAAIAPRAKQMPKRPQGARAISKDPKSRPGGRTHAGTISRCASTPFTLAKANDTKLSLKSSTIVV